MKTKTYILSLLVAMSAAFACSKGDLDPATDETPVVVDNSSHILVPFSAEAGATQTRVEMKDGSTTNIVFSAGDQLLVYCFQTLETSLLTLKSGAGEKTAIFEGDLVLASGKTEADLAGKTLHAVLIPKAGAMMGIFSYKAMFGQLTVDYSKGSIDSNLEALVARTILYEGETKYEDRKFTFRMMNSYVKMDVTVPSEESDLARNYTVEVTNDWHICANATCGRVGWNTGTYSSTVSGTFTASSATGGTLYMAVLADNQIRITDDGALYDEVDFNIRMDNVYKEYDLLGGTISKAVIPPGRGITKSVTLKDPDNEDVLLGQPQSVRNRFFDRSSSCYGDINANGMLSKYEAAQLKTIYLSQNTDLKDASFCQYFTGLKDLRSMCFTLCTSMKKVILPKYLETIGATAFSECNDLTSIVIPQSIREIGHHAFKESAITYIIIPSKVKTLDIGVFENCTSLKDVVFDGCVLDSLGKALFKGCTALESAALPSGIKRVPEQIFMNCESLEAVSIPSGVTSIDKEAFRYCSSLKGVTIPSSVKSIGEYAFAFCSSFTSVVVPKNVAEIGNFAFNTCGPNFTRISFLRTNPAVLGGVFVFTNNPNLKIYVPTLQVDIYKAADMWKADADRIYPML